jgi:hypothetical protein
MTAPPGPCALQPPYTPIAHNEDMARLLLAGVLLAALLAACRKDDNSEPPDTSADPATLLRDAAAAVQEAGTFHFKLSHENGTTPLPLGLELVSAEGDFQVPGRLAADVRARATGGINVSVKVIAIDDQTWMTNPFTRAWQRIPGASLRDLADPGALVTTLLPKVNDPALTDGGEVDGVRTLKVEGTIDSGELREALSFARAGHSVRVETWIGVEDGLPRRLRLSGRLVSDEGEDVRRQIDLSRFGESVQISPP